MEIIEGFIGVAILIGWLLLAASPYILLICGVICAIKATIRFLFK